MIRTLVTLWPGEKQDGTRCLKGTLTRAVTTVDDNGHERTYPAGTKLVLSKNHATGSYSLLAMLEDEARAAAEELQREAASITAEEREHAIPF